MITGTSYFFDRARDRMAALSASADRQNQEISTGKKVLAPSDAPAGWQRLQGLTQAKADGTAYSANIAIAQGVLDRTDSTLLNVQDRLQRANQLAIQANSGVLSTTDRNSIAAELDTIVADLTSLAATKDVRGQPLFDASAADIPLGEGISVRANSDPTAVFGTIIATLTTYAGQLRTANASTNTTNSTAAIAAIATATTNVAAQQGAVGARAARVELFAATAQDAAMVTEAQRASIEDVDPYAAFVELQKTMTILSATQASFSKLTSLSLFDYMR